MPFLDKNKLREYQREWVAARRREFFADKCCAVCKTKKNLELDHKDPKKKTSHKIWSWSKVRREAEIKKCQVLCKKHHLDKSIKESIKRNSHLV